MLETKVDALAKRVDTMIKSLWALIFSILGGVVIYLITLTIGAGTHP